VASHINPSRVCKTLFIAVCGIPSSVFQESMRYWVLLSPSPLLVDSWLAELTSSIDPTPRKMTEDRIRVTTTLMKLNGNSGDFNRGDERIA